LTVSVVIAWVNSFDLLRPGLDALLAQRGAGAIEMIVATRRAEVDQVALRTAYPGVRLLVAPANTSIPALRSLALKQARGTVVAVTEDHCVPCPDWVERIGAAIEQRGAGLVGGPVENAWTGRLRDRAAFLTEYAGAIRPTMPEPTRNLPGNNVAYSSALVPGLCRILDSGRWESFYHQQLAALGEPLIYDPDLLVYHRRPFDFWYFVAQRFHFSRSFAAMRNQSLSRRGRLAYGLGSAALPPFLILRGLRTLQRKRRFVGQYLLALPLIAAYTCAGAVGEMCGYLLGGGASLARVE
jgi:GT2 family glycosyltransferase